MNNESPLLAELRASPVPTLLADSELTPLHWNEAARLLLPALAAERPLPEQFPSVLWLTVPSALRLMRPAAIVLGGSGERLLLTLLPMFEGGSLSRVSGVLSPAAAPVQDPAYAMALHDLSTPIASISSCTDLLAAHVPERQQPYLQIIRRGTLQIQRILSGMAVSIDASLSVSSSSVDLADMARALVEQVRPLVSQNTALSLTLVMEGRPVARCNSGQMERVLLNLLSNAIKFAAHRISVSVGHAGEQATIAVENDGPCIPPRDLPHIFTPWFTRGGSGSGLGLSAVDQLTRLNGGRVDVESAAGHTRFVVTLPLAAEGDLAAGGGPYQLAQSRHATLYELELALGDRDGAQRSAAPQLF